MDIAHRSFSSDEAALKVGVAWTKSLPLSIALEMVRAGRRRHAVRCRAVYRRIPAALQTDWAWLTAAKGSVVCCILFRGRWFLGEE